MLSKQTAATIAAVKISEYMTSTENGIEYNNDKINQLFSEMKSGAIPEENYYIVEKILLSCVSDQGLNTDEIEYIINCSKEMVVKNVFTETKDGKIETSIEYNQGM